VVPQAPSPKFPSLARRPFAAVARFLLRMLSHALFGYDHSKCVSAKIHLRAGRSARQRFFAMDVAFHSGPRPSGGVNPYCNLPPEQSATQQVVEQRNPDERLWRKLEPKRPVRRNES
jgi:hypothetical protein